MIALQQSNMSMEKPPMCRLFFPASTNNIYRGFPFATFDDRRVVEQNPQNCVDKEFVPFNGSKNQSVSDRIAKNNNNNNNEKKSWGSSSELG